MCVRVFFCIVLRICAIRQAYPPSMIRVDTLSYSISNVIKRVFRCRFLFSFVCFARPRPE